MTVKNVPFSINGREIGINNPPYCIAEVGINHNGSLDQAKKMIEVAKQAGSTQLNFRHLKLMNSVYQVKCLLISRREKK